MSSTLVVMVLVVVGLIGSAPAAEADRAPRFGLSVTPRAVHGGEQLGVRAEAPTSCTWLLEWNGERQIGRDRDSFTASFTAPQVSRPTRLALHGTCFYNAPVASHQRDGATGTIVVRIPPSWHHTVVVTVLPAGTSVSPPTTANATPTHGGGLPGTGGPALLALVAGLCAVAAGGALVRRSSVRGARPGSLEPA